MKTSEDVMEASRALDLELSATDIQLSTILAIMQGWSNIVDVDGTLLGYHDHFPMVRGQGCIPIPIKDDAACFRLMCDMHLFPCRTPTKYAIFNPLLGNVIIADMRGIDTPTRSESIRRLVVCAAIRLYVAQAKNLGRSL